MPKGGLAATFNLYREALRRCGRDGLPLRLRLFVFLLLFLNTIMAGVLLILFSTGVFQAGLSEHKAVLDRELDHIAQNIYKDFGAISIQAVDLAKALAANIERNLQDQGSSVLRLQEDSRLLEYLLEEEMGRLTGALEKSAGSGVFLLLDATVNPALPEAQNSRSCIYLKNMEPNIVNGMAANLRYRFGPMSIARKNKITLLPQWEMEMDTGAMTCFTEVMAMARERSLPVSRLYRWNEAQTLPDSSERAMLCMAPLIASDGTVFGVCGFEISEMLFKLSYTSRGEDYDHLICLLSPFEEDSLLLSGALFAGGFAAGPTAPKHTKMNISFHEGDFHLYRQPEKESYTGLQQQVALYPSNSAYEQEQWLAVLLMPEKVLSARISHKNRNLILGLLALMLANIGLAALISRKYIRPVTEALEKLKNPGPVVKTKIPEIDDLIEFLAAQDELAAAGEKKELPVPAPSALYLEFEKNIKALSAAEKAVFDLYVQGYTAQEIAGILCLSINTIKTHNRRIYMKLNVTSRKELMIYIQMMGEGGCIYAEN